MAKKKTEFKMRKNPKKIKLGELFEVEGKLYAIQIPATASHDSYLAGGRQIYEFCQMTEL
jgi:hypothetical protein